MQHTHRDRQQQCFTLEGQAAAGCVRVCTPTQKQRQHKTTLKAHTEKASALARLYQQAAEVAAQLQKIGLVCALTGHTTQHTPQYTNTATNLCTSPTCPVPLPRCAVLWSHLRWGSPRVPRLPPPSAAAAGSSAAPAAPWRPPSSLCPQQQQPQHQRPVGSRKRDTREEVWECFCVRGGVF